MKKITSIFFLTTAIGFSMATYSCTEGQSNDGNEVQFDSLAISEKIPIAFIGKDTAYTSVDIRYKFPKDMPDIEKLIAKNFFADSLLQFPRKESLTKYARSFGEDFSSLEPLDSTDTDNDEKSDYLLSLYSESYFYKSDSILFNRNNFLSVDIISDGMAPGAAHPIHNNELFTIDTKNRKLVTENELFVDNYKPLLTKIIIDKIAKKFNCKTAAELMNEGLFSIDNIEPNGNFALCDDYILYCYNEYEIAAYAVGKIVIEIPYEELTDLLRNDSPIKELIKE